MKTAFVCFILLLLCSCNEKQSPDKYQIAVSASGSAYRLNVSTGEVWSITSDGLIKLQESKEVGLIVGNYYKAEDGKTLKYLGKAQLEYWNPKTAEEYLEKIKK